MKAVLWDLDDTLLDTLPGRMDALRHAFQHCLGRAVDPLEVWRSHQGGTLEALARSLLGEDHATFSTAYREHYYGNAERSIALYPGIEAMLEELRSHGLVLGVVTSKISWGARAELERSGLLPFFGAIVGHDDVARPKPEPDPIFEAMRRLDIESADEVLFVGDSPADIRAAHAARCAGVAALWGTIDRDLLLATLPKFLAEEPPGVLEAFLQSRMRAGGPAK
jgi:HAD superfamily hydrolase (TIGR01509 family)